MATERTNEERRQQLLRQDEVPSGGGTQGSSDADSGPPPPDMMLGLWMPWMERYFGAARDWIDSDKPWWQVTPYDLFVNNVERRTAATIHNPSILSSRFCRSLRRWLPEVEACTQYKVLIYDAFTGRPCSRETA